MENKLLKISVVIFILFAFAGVSILSVIFHELFHVWDYKSVAKNGTICFLEYGRGSIGSYNFQFNSSDEQKIKQIDKYAEIKSYSISLLIWIIFLISIIIIELYYLDNFIYKRDE